MRILFLVFIIYPFFSFAEVDPKDGIYELTGFILNIKSGPVLIINPRSRSVYRIKIDNPETLSSLINQNKSLAAVHTKAMLKTNKNPHAKLLSVRPLKKNERILIYDSALNQIKK